MKMFYSDTNIVEYEKKCEFKKVLQYLEHHYCKYPNRQILCSLIGFSWYYLVEGPELPLENETDCLYILQIWKRYIDLGDVIATNDPYFNFIVGYTLSLHGFYIEQRYEDRAAHYMKKCAESEHDLLSQLAKNFLINEMTSVFKFVSSPKYTRLFSIWDMVELRQS